MCVENHVQNVYVNHVENQVENCFEVQKKPNQFNFLVEIYTIFLFGTYDSSYEKLESMPGNNPEYSRNSVRCYSRIRYVLKLSGRFHFSSSSLHIFLGCVIYHYVFWIDRKCNVYYRAKSGFDPPQKYPCPSIYINMLSLPTSSEHFNWNLRVKLSTPPLIMKGFCYTFEKIYPAVPFWHVVTVTLFRQLFLFLMKI